MRTLKICCTSDWHGKTPPLDWISECDLLIIAGDIVPNKFWHKDDCVFEAAWLEKTRWYLDSLAKTRKIIFVPGNHDFIWQERPELVPPDLPWEVLIDSTLIWENLYIHGTPWTPYFHGWAFGGHADTLISKYRQIPDCTDILVSHGPPYGILDRNMGDERCGSNILLNRLDTLKDLRLHVFGHIHESYGAEVQNGIQFLNCAYMNDRYLPTNKPHLVEIDIEN